MLKCVLMWKYEQMPSCYPYAKICCSSKMYHWIATQSKSDTCGMVRNEHLDMRKPDMNSSLTHSMWITTNDVYASQRICLSSHKRISLRCSGPFISKPHPQKKHLFWYFHFEHCKALYGEMCVLGCTRCSVPWSKRLSLLRSCKVQYVFYFIYFFTPVDHLTELVSIILFSEDAFLLFHSLV